MKKRRGRGEGSIIYRPGEEAWAAVVTVGYDANGKRRRRWVRARTKSEVLEKLHALRQDAKTGTLAEPNRVTLATFLERWLQGARYRPTTRADRETTIHKHITPYLGGVAVSRLTPIAIQELLIALEDDGVGAATREKIYNILHRSLRDAVAWRLVARHPCEGVASPRYSAPAITPFTPTEVAAFFEAARGSRLHALYVLLATTGMRLGEALGLGWDAVDLRRGTVTITRQLSEVRGRVELTQPKTPRSRREIPLPAFAMAALKEHRARQLAAGYYRADALVFTDTDGKPLRRSNLRRRSYYPMLVKAGLPRRTLHSLRHSVATALLCEGHPVQVISAMLGHARPSITLNVYAAYTPAMGREAAASLDRLLTVQPNRNLTGGFPDTPPDGDGISAESGKPVVTPLSDVRGR